MATWRCPHCATPQAESARCWVCRRSTTICATCRHFQRSIKPGVGFCELDRLRLPLPGSERRPCWEAAGGLMPRLVPVVIQAWSADRPAPPAPMRQPLWEDAEA